MTLNEYQELAKRTCPDLFPDQNAGSFLNAAHMIYGMISEIPELLDAFYKQDQVNVGEELSDQNWYLANYCNFNNIKLQDLVIVDGVKDIPGRTYVEKIVYYIGELADLEKKELAYKKSFSAEKQIDILQNLFYWICSAYRDSKINIYESLEKNINKLKVRFPEKFETEKALNRDLDAERKVLE